MRADHVETTLLGMRRHLNGWLPALLTGKPADGGNNTPPPAARGRGETETPPFWRGRGRRWSAFPLLFHRTGRNEDIMSFLMPMFTTNG